MPALYRVFPFLAGAGPREPGGALYIPPQRGGRLDNPGFYEVFYAGDAAAGAIAEAFGRFPEWSAAILEGSPSLPGSVRALARYHLPDTAPICDLDNPDSLRRLGLRPSDVVSRDYERTRAWARKIYETGRWAGVRWWSYYDPRWGSFGIWNQAGLTLEDVTRYVEEKPLRRPHLLLQRPASHALPLPRGRIIKSLDGIYTASTQLVRHRQCRPRGRRLTLVEVEYFPG